MFLRTVNSRMRLFWLRFLFLAMLGPILMDLCNGFSVSSIIVSFFSLIDEIFVILLFSFSLLFYREIKLGLFEIVLILFLIVGFVSCVNNDVPLKVSLLGAFNITKPMLIYVCFRQFQFRFKELIRLFKWFGYLYPFLVFSDLLDFFIPNFRSIIGYTSFQLPDIRAGIRSVYGFLRPTQVTFLASTLYFIYSIYIKKKKIYLYSCASMVLMTLKVKEFVAFFMSWAFGFQKKVKFYFIVIGGGLFIILFYAYSFFLPEHYDTYFGADDEYSNARVALVYTSVRIMNDKMPFGVGFGRFASSTSEQIESPVYHEYGIDMVWGLNYDAKSTFMDDCFWPMIFGETGVLGTLIYILLLVICFGPYLKCYFINTEDKRYAMVALVFIFMLVCSLAKATLNGPPQSFLLWGLAGSFHNIAFGNNIQFKRK